MNLNESDPKLRTVKARFYSAGAPLPSGHVFSTGDLKIVQPDGTVANATNLPTAVAGAATGSFDIIVVQSELQQKGQIRLQLNGSGVDAWEWVEPVDDAVVKANDARLNDLDASISSVLAAIAAGGGGGGGGGGTVTVDYNLIAATVHNYVLDTNAPATFQTLKHLCNVLMAWLAGGANGFPFTVQQQLTYQSVGDPTKTRLAGTVSNGQRTISGVDGT